MKAIIDKKKIEDPEGYTKAERNGDSSFYLNKELKEAKLDPSIVKSYQKSLLENDNMATIKNPLNSIDYQDITYSESTELFGEKLLLKDDSIHTHSTNYTTAIPSKDRSQSVDAIQFYTSDKQNLQPTLEIKKSRSLSKKIKENKIKRKGLEELVTIVNPTTLNSSASFISETNDINNISTINKSSSLGILEHSTNHNIVQTGIAGMNAAPTNTLLASGMGLNPHHSTPMRQQLGFISSSSASSSVNTLMTPLRIRTGSGTTLNEMTTINPSLESLNNNSSNIANPLNNDFNNKLRSIDNIPIVSNISPSHTITNALNTNSRQMLTKLSVPSIPISSLDKQEQSLSTQSKVTNGIKFSSAGSTSNISKLAAIQPIAINSIQYDTSNKSHYSKSSKSGSTTITFNAFTVPALKFTLDNTEYVSNPNQSTTILTNEQYNDMLLQERLQEAKAMNRKNDSGAIMHKFSLWNKVASKDNSTTISSTSSTPTSINDHTIIGISKSFPEPVKIFSEATHSGNNVASNISTVAIDDSSNTSTQNIKKSSKLRGPKAVRESYQTTIVDCNDSEFGSNSSIDEPIHIIKNDSESNLNSEDDSNIDRLNEFQVIPTGFSSSLASSLRSKVVDAKQLSNSSLDINNSNSDKHQSPCELVIDQVKVKSEIEDVVDNILVDDWDDNYIEVENIEQIRNVEVTSNSNTISSFNHTIDLSKDTKESLDITKRMSQSGPAAFGSLTTSSSSLSTEMIQSDSSAIQTIKKASNYVYDIQIHRSFSNENILRNNDIDVNSLHRQVMLLTSLTSRDHISDNQQEYNLKDSKINSNYNNSNNNSNSKYDAMKQQSRKPPTKIIQSNDRVELTNVKDEHMVTSETFDNILISHEQATNINNEIIVDSLYHKASEGQTLIDIQDIKDIEDQYKNHKILEQSLVDLSTSTLDNDANSPTLSELSELDDMNNNYDINTNNPLDFTNMNTDKYKLSTAAATTITNNNNQTTQDISNTNTNDVDEYNNIEEEATTESPLRWRKGEIIGEGTFGNVYKGLNEKTGELLAIKQLCLCDSSDSKEIESLCKEINVMWNLEHDNIVRYLGTARTNRYLFIILEYVTGGSVAGMIKQFGAFSEKLVRRFALHIFSGVAYLHSKGIIHRDIKGANILVSDTGIAKLSDFGCSKQLVGLCTGSIEESMKAIRGSVPWMAPEVIKQSGHGRSSDIWSIGATMIEMSTGKPPWSDFTNDLSALFHVATTNKPPTIPDFLSSTCKECILKCFQINPDDRPSAIDLLNSFDVLK